MGTTPRMLHILSFPGSTVSLHFSKAQSWPLLNPTTPLSLNPCPSLHLPSWSIPPRWDSNAESVRTQNFGLDFGEDDGDGEEENDGVRPGSGKGDSGLLQEVIDNVWIFKVLSSYGWLLPGIILSMLLASGPKAFLMALALPLGQSAISLALQKLWAIINGGSKRNRASFKKRRSSRASTSNVKMGEGRRGSKTQKRKMGYQSWVARGNGPVGGRDAPSFGGWEELDEELQESNEGSIGRRKADGPERKLMEGGKFSRRKGGGEVPLLLRLLVAVFPFLGSWTKVL